MKKRTAVAILTCILVIVFMILLVWDVDDEKPSEGTLSPDSTLSPDNTLSPETTLPPVTTSAPVDTVVPDTTVLPETTAAPTVDVIPDVTLWDKDAHEITDLLSMKICDIKAKYGTLILAERDSRANLSVYTIEKLGGVLLIFENRDRTLALDDMLTPDKIRLTADYEGEIAGLKIGEDGEGVLWNDAVCADAPATMLIGADYIITALYEETDATFPDGYPGWSDEKLAAWREAFCKKPVGNIVDITVEKKKEILPKGELEVISNLYNTSVHDVEMPLRTSLANYTVFDYDDRYVLYVIENRNVWPNLMSGKTDTYNIELYVIDTLLGKVIYNENIATVTDENGVNDHRVQLLHTEKAAELSIVTWQGERIVSYDLDISESGTFLTEKDSVLPYVSRERHTSPDGKYTVFCVYEDLVDCNGGIDLLMDDGSCKRLLANNPGGEGLENYNVYGFIDDTTFAYSIGGWEHIKGYGTYNIATGEKKEYRGTDHLIAAHDGYIYIKESERYDDAGMRVGTALCSIDKDGNRKRIAAMTVFRLEDGKRIYICEAKAGEVDLANTSQFFEGLGWLVIDDTVNFYSADFSKLLVSIDPPSDNTRLYENVHVYNRAITVVTPRYKG